MRTMIVGIGLVLAAIVVQANAVDLKPIVESYLRIQRALATDRLDGVTSAAGTIARLAAGLGADGKPIRAAADQLQRATDLETARAGFGELGDAIMTAAKRLGVEVGDGVKIAYCPMVRKYWLQTDQTIQNPYFGKEMLDCGRFAPELPDLNDDDKTPQ